MQIVYKDMTSVNMIVFLSILNEAQLVLISFCCTGAHLCGKASPFLSDLHDVYLHITIMY
jgi:hypothetical protein